MTVQYPKSVTQNAGYNVANMIYNVDCVILGLGLRETR